SPKRRAWLARPPSASCPPSKRRAGSRPAGACLKSFGLISLGSRWMTAEPTVKIKEKKPPVETYRLFFDSNPQPMVIIDRKSLKFVEVNGAALRLYGFTRQEFLSRLLPELWPEKDRPSYLEMLGGLPAEGLHEVGLRRHQKKDGTPLTVSVTSHMLEYKG